MGDGMRKRKSLWDVEEDSKKSSWTQKEHYSTNDGSHRRNWSPSEADNNLVKPKDQSRWVSRVPLELNKVAYKNERFYEDGRDASQMQELCEKNNRYNNMTPGFDGWGQRKRNHSPDDSLGQSHRYHERGRSRDRGRSRGRSRSWSRDRGRDRGSDWSKSRSRSRSRSRNRKLTRSRSRSRSPSYDCRRESSGWSDRRSGTGVSSQTCRDFAVGKCRRGSQCRFLHPDNMYRTDGDYSENDLAERSRNRAERGSAGRYPNSEGPGVQSRDKASDVNYREDEPFRNRSKGTVCCKDFLRGKCKWGASCRFLHDVVSGDNSIRHAPFDHSNEQQTSETGKTLCKFFLAGKCHRLNCRFSHDGPTPSSHEDRLNDEGGRSSLMGKNERWNGPKWDEVGKGSNALRTTGWSERVSANTSTTNTWGHESKAWVGAQSQEKVLGNDRYSSPHRWNKNDSGDMVPMKLMSIGNLDDRYKDHLKSQFAASESTEEFSMPARAPDMREEASSQHLTMTTMRTDAYVESDIQQHHGGVEDNNVKAFNFDGADEVKDSGNIINLALVPGQSLNQKGVGNMLFGHSVVSKDQGDKTFFSYPSNGRNIDLNGPGQLLHSSVSLQNQAHSHQKEAAKMPEVREFVASQSFPVNPSCGQVAPIAYHVASPTQKLVTEQVQPHPHTALNPLSSMGLISSSKSLVPPINMMYIQSSLDVKIPDHHNMLGDGREPDKTGLSDQLSGNLPYAFEQQNEMILEPFSPETTVNPESLKTLQSCSGVVQDHESPKSKQQETNAVSEVLDNKGNDVVEHKEVPENIHKENVDGNGKAEDGTGNKDDKEMRIFKNALVEFVKEILKPKWKEGRMSRDVHKTIVKKVVDKVTSTIQGDHIPKTQDRIEQYLSYSKAKITKLVQAYVERHLKDDS